MKRLLLFATKPRVMKMAREMGFSVVNFDKAARVDDERRSLVDHAEAIDWDDPQDYLAKALRLHMERPFDAVAAFGEYTVYPAALVKEHLGLVGNPLRPVFVANEKPLLRSLLSGVDDFAVRFQRIDGRPLDVGATADGLCAKLGLPLIVKPTNSSGSAGVTLCRTLADVVQRLSTHDYASPLLAEEFLEGPEISVEAFSAFGVHTVLAITAKETTGAPRFIETGHHQPAPLSSTDDGDVRRAVTAMLDLIGHDLGPSHTELRLTSRGPRLIETHTRPGGDGIAELTEMTTGFDVFRETLVVIKSICELGFAAAKAAYRPPVIATVAHASSQFFLWTRGELVELTGMDEARAGSGVVELAVTVNPGDLIPEPVDSHTRHGSFVVTGASRGEVDARVAAVRATVQTLIR